MVVMIWSNLWPRPQNIDNEHYSYICANNMTTNIRKAQTIHTLKYTTTKFANINIKSINTRLVFVLGNWNSKLWFSLYQIFSAIATQCTHILYLPGLVYTLVQIVTGKVHHYCEGFNLCTHKQGTINIPTGCGDAEVKCMCTFHVMWKKAFDYNISTSPSDDIINLILIFFI